MEEEDWNEILREWKNHVGRVDNPALRTFIVNAKPRQGCLAE